MNSIARPEFRIERRLAPRPAVPAAQLPLQRHEARVAGSPLQEDHIWNDSLVTTRVTARAHLVEHAQIFETEGVAWRHGMRLSIPAALSYGTNDEHVNSQALEIVNVWSPASRAYGRTGVRPPASGSAAS